jgi:hypothetical protein
MIQRKQSLFLFFALALWGVIYFFPVASVFDVNSVYILKADGLYSQKEGTSEIFSNAYPFLIIYILIMLLQIIVFSLFKKRGVQMRLCLVLAILQAAFLMLAFYYVYQALHDAGQSSVSWGFSALLPICSAILNLLAYRYIHKDEEIVKSIDRIR